jgi:DnaJ-class molecular chaperone
MIHFNQIANPPQPTYRPMCVACEGRGVVPSLSIKSVQRCEQCNGTGKEGNTPEQADAGAGTDEATP